MVRAQAIVQIFAERSRTDTRGHVTIRGHDDARLSPEETRPLADGGTMRVISARYDLSGRPEMLWAADDGTPAGSARCTQNFRFAQGQKPAVRKNMLLCWRNTTDRSVVVLAVSHTGAPNNAQVLNVLDTQWDRL